MRTERILDRGFLYGEAMVRLKELPVFVKQRDQANGRVANIRRQTGDVIVRFFGEGIKKIQLPQRL